MKKRLARNKFRRTYRKKHDLKTKYISMITRCYYTKHPRFKDWGGRGIQVCEEWKNDPKSFYVWSINNGYKPGLFLDRINNDGNYEPSNCRFITRTASVNNRRPYKKKSKLPIGVGCDPNSCRTKRYIAGIRISNKPIYLGYWSTPEEASKQYQCVNRIKQCLINGGLL